MAKNLLAMQETQVQSLGWEGNGLPTPVFLPEEFHRQRSLVDYSPWGHKESDMTEQQTLTFKQARLCHVSIGLCLSYSLCQKWMTSSSDYAFPKSWTTTVLNRMLSSPVSFLPQCYVATIIILLILQMSTINPICIGVKRIDSREGFGSSS